MDGFSVVDYGALAFFVASWLGYHVAVEMLPAGRRSLNKMMDEHRRGWMAQMLRRDMRIIDTTIMASLQNGTAFFASTSLLAVGGALTLLASTDAALTVFADLPFGFVTTRLSWEVKVMGLAVLFVYAFFKFAWSYRLFNYAAILLGAVPMAHAADDPEARAAAARAAAMNVVAGRHFNRGQRAFFFALAYLGWFVSAYLLFATTAAVLWVMWRRQFASDAVEALEAR
ncbi:DUF599 domain-containing protein [Salinarimonas soli]|uniref:DUF599 family protein n=1 Tax=Salinarimonas soli TaxID=1638099 RepID=A0A5B2VHM7_9HYPH|nr:DUF599 family protein [Salinarimonas soli]KAA2237990.1 DUF599 family protein [Salinarimonas soli]